MDNIQSAIKFVEGWRLLKASNLLTVQNLQLLKDNSSKAVNLAEFIKIVHADEASSEFIANWLNVSSHLNDAENEILIDVIKKLFDHDVLTKTILNKCLAKPGKASALSQLIDVFDVGDNHYSNRGQRLLTAENILTIVNSNLTSDNILVVADYLGKLRRLRSYNQDDFTGILNNIMYAPNLFAAMQLINLLSIPQDYKSRVYKKFYENPIMLLH